MKKALDNQQAAFLRYLNLRKEYPHELRIEAVFSYSCWEDVVAASWPVDTMPTHGSLLRVFFESKAIVMIPKTFFDEVMSECLK